MLFVKRDVVTVYKQTVLGPLWYLIQPLFTSITFTIIFNNLAGISTGTVPPFLFNLAESRFELLTACLTGPQIHLVPMQEFWESVFSIIVPISIVISNLLKFESSFAYLSPFIYTIIFRVHKFKCHKYFIRC
jgi:lipopolysaccharide transport system permease protein